MRHGVENEQKARTSRFLATYGPIALNLVLFGIFGVDAVKRVWRTTQAGTCDFVEISFAVQTAVMVFMILWRGRHRAVDPSLWNQAVALTAVFSGLLLTDLPAGNSDGIALVAKLTVFVANLLGIMTLLNLGRSFGFLIALREVRTTGLYGVIRHPMYFTDILLRVGYVLANVSAFNIAVFLFSSGAYVYRAILEERFLMQTPEYREFADRVQYRFLPGVF
jgi:protein-S-isoprenylcysteine O-methyltransferase Ste14